MKHITEASKEWTHKPGYSKKILLNPEELGKEGILVQKLQIAPGQNAKNHVHKKQTEIFYFLNTVGEFIVNKKRINLHVGDILVVEPGDWHSTSNSSDANFEYIAFKYDWVDGDYYE
jgi:quercetin dioxygenase-like cupin family protein